MTISAKVIAHSIADGCPPLPTLQLRYPKFIHGEAKTHRMLRINDAWVDLMEEVGFMDDTNFSRNASSSRAIPVERLIRDVIDDPVYPSFWGKNQPGMSAAEECNELVSHSCHSHARNLTREQAWDEAREHAITTARAYAAAGYHKQIVNRLLEPFCHINVVVTSVHWSNFFALRCHPGAQPEMRELAEKMFAAIATSEPRRLEVGQWHLPYADDTHHDDGTGKDMISVKLSVARCARVSYLTQEGKKPTIEDDLKLYDRLMGSVPLHASPAEHQATPDQTHKNVFGGHRDHRKDDWHRPHLHGNLTGWIQYRKTLDGECQ